MKVAPVLIGLLFVVGINGQDITSFFTTLNPDTGDFGGLPFGSRSEFSSFVNFDSHGHPTSFGVKIPSFDRLTLQPSGFGNPSQSAIIRFNRTGIEDFLPYHALKFDFNPDGHPEDGWLQPHFDLHVLTISPEELRGIVCKEFTPTLGCVLTPFLADLFADEPDGFFPPGYVASPLHYVPTHGAHYSTLPIPDIPTFATTPSDIYGGYNGRVLFHEPMVAKTIFDDVMANGPKTFSFTTAPKQQTKGYFYSKYTIDYDGSVPGSEFFIITFHDLFRDDYFGENNFYFGSLLGGDTTATSASSKQVCGVITSNGSVGGGYEVDTPMGWVCCRSRGTFDGTDCVHDSCGITVPFQGDPSFAVSGSVCYANCYERY